LGRKRTGTGKYVFLFLALVIVTVGSGCTAVDGILKKQEAGFTLEEGRHYLASGNFDRYVEINQQVLSDFPKTPPGDEALFNLGRVFSHPEYSRRDYKVALRFFKWLSADFPESPFEKRSRTWISLLENIEKSDKDLAAAWKRCTETQALLEAARKKIEESTAKQEEDKTIRDPFLHGRGLLAAGEFEASVDYHQKLLARFGSKAPADEALFNLGLAFSHPGYPKKDYGRALGYFRRLLREFPQSPHLEETKILVEVLDVIEQSKKVDLEIQKKKKELIR
jgi:tetratricopeptide (TPR) repeat protein